MWPRSGRRGTDAPIDAQTSAISAEFLARIARLVYGAEDAKGGAVRSCFNVLDHAQLNHRVSVTAGILAQEAAELLKDFFAARR